MTAPKEECYCNCVYRCGGPGYCCFDPFECLQQEEGHFVRDCGHDFSIWKETEYGGTKVCSRCGMSAMSHDEIAGP